MVVLKFELLPLAGLISSLYGSWLVGERKDLVSNGIAKIKLSFGFS
jgi:hypothetical protein